VPASWPIRKKLQLGLGLLLVMVLSLFGSAYYGLYAYRGLVKGLSARSVELPLASKIRQHVGDLRVTLSQAHDRLESPGAVNAAALVRADSLADSEALTSGTIAPIKTKSEVPLDQQLLREQYQTQMELLTEALDRYRRQLDRSQADADSRLGDDWPERDTLAKIDTLLARFDHGHYGDPFEEDWLLDRVRIDELREEVEQLRTLVAELPSHLHQRLQVLSGEVSAQYRTAIVTAWITTILATILLGISARMFYLWIADPLQQLVQGAREVAAGKFDYRIGLQTRDEMGELAEAMNAMMQSFQETRDDLDTQVRIRTNQVVRSEQLASGGFLAEGVAHEINNPLASIALCSESLEGRLSELLDAESSPSAEDVEVAHNYMQMIQQEAFRCKQITEKLLDFARLGDSQRHRTDLRELTSSVIEMVQHLGKYQDKNLLFMDGDPVIVQVNAQEIKQVVLNLITNGLESVEEGGMVRVSVQRDPKSQAGSLAQIIVWDDGCGMTDEVRKHLFEPFFTRRHTGQGTGLGLSITYRIVEEHHGQIEVQSEGAGKGSRFVVSLPVNQVDHIATIRKKPGDKEAHHGYQAA